MHPGSKKLLGNCYWINSVLCISSMGLRHILLKFQSLRRALKRAHAYVQIDPIAIFVCRLRPIAVLHLIEIGLLLSPIG